MRLAGAALLLACSTSSAAFAEVSISLRGGYFFDDTASELSSRYVSDNQTPQAALFGFGVGYEFPEGHAAEDWRIAVSGLWGRGNESYQDVDVIRQDDELIVARDINSTLQFFTGYRYEYTGVRTRDDGRVIQPGPDIPLGAPATLVRTTEGQVRHSLRAGFAIDVPIAPDEAVFNSEPAHRASASFALVGAIGRDSVSYLVDDSPAPGVQEHFITVRENDIRRAGPELTFGYRWHANERATLDIRYRGAFLFDSFSSATNVNAVHGITLALSYQLTGR
jgi:hypothetical protein